MCAVCSVRTTTKNGACEENQQQFRFGSPPFYNLHVPPYTSFTAPSSGQGPHPTQQPILGVQQFGHIVDGNGNQYQVDPAHFPTGQFWPPEAINDHQQGQYFPQYYYDDNGGMYEVVIQDADSAGKTAVGGDGTEMPIMMNYPEHEHDYAGYQPPHMYHSAGHVSETLKDVSNYNYDSNSYQARSNNGRGSGSLSSIELHEPQLVNNENHAPPRRELRDHRHHKLPFGQQRQAALKLPLRRIATPPHRLSEEVLQQLTTKYNHQRFPFKLYGLANETSFPFISWSEDGTSLLIDESNLEPTLGRFFRSGKYSSFLRQLHLYGFRKVTRATSQRQYRHGDINYDDDVDRVQAQPLPPMMQPGLEYAIGEYWAENFKRGHYDLLSKVKRYYPQSENKAPAAADHVQADEVNNYNHYQQQQALEYHQQQQVQQEQQQKWEQIQQQQYQLLPIGYSPIGRDPREPNSKYLFYPVQDHPIHLSLPGQKMIPTFSNQQPHPSNIFFSSNVPHQYFYGPSTAFEAEVETEQEPPQGPVEQQYQARPSNTDGGADGNRNSTEPNLTILSNGKQTPPELLQPKTKSPSLQDCAHSPQR